jgi:hypothetical protein
MLRGFLALVIASTLGASLFASAHLQLHAYNARAAERLAAITLAAR